MKKDPKDNTKWIPDGDITCGVKCDKSTGKPYWDGGEGGPGFCVANPPQLCGTGNLHSKEQQTNVYEGCFDKKKWVKCDKSICKGTTTTEACDSNGYCKLQDYCGKDNSSTTPKQNKYYACKNDPDCSDNYGNTGKCTKISKTTDHNLQAKKITDVGYCTKKNTDDPPLIFDKGSKNCGTLDQIGNTKSGEVVVCDSSISGVNGSIQCPEAEDGCAKNGICSTNGWEARFTASSDTNCAQGPWKTGTKPFCCDPASTITSDSGGKWCCSVKDDKDCRNVTNFGYSANMLGISNTNYTDTISCTKDGNQCEQHNDKFIKTLTVGGFTPNSTDLNSEKFAKLYCDTTTDPANPVCKAQCGFIDTNRTPEKPSQYAVSDDPQKVSYCIPKNNSCQENSSVDYPYGDPINDIPICYSTAAKTDEDRKNNLYWSAIPGNAGKGLQYNTKFKVSFTGENCNMPNMCMNRAKNTSGVFNVVPNDDDKSCTLTADCGYMSYRPKGMTKNILWKDGLTQLDVSNVPDGWKPIAQNNPYHTTPGGPGGKICTGTVADNTAVPPYKIPVSLTTPLQTYDPSMGKCTGNHTAYKTQLNTTGRYCPNGISAYTNSCLSSE